MSDDLDHLMARLAATPMAMPASLDQEVMALIASRREELRKSRTLAPLRVASVGAAMLIGVLAGGAAALTAAAEPRHFSTFSTDAHLAPSTLLEGRG
jgi:hypothetical protein